MIEPLEIYKEINVFAKENGMELALVTPGETKYMDHPT